MLSYTVIHIHTHSYTVMQVIHRQYISIICGGRHDIFGWKIASFSEQFPPNMSLSLSHKLDILAQPYGIPFIAHDYSFLIFTLKRKTTSTTPSCSGPLPPQKDKGPFSIKNT